jgi:hypothetical protein
MALSELFYRAEPNPPEHERGLHRRGQPVADVLNDAGIGYIATEDILSVLAERHYDLEHDRTDFEEGPFGHNARYAKRKPVDAGDFEYDWFDFEKNLKTEARYFNRLAEATLASVFEGIDGHKTIDGRPVVVEADPARKLRCFIARESSFRTWRSSKRP